MIGERSCLSTLPTCCQHFCVALGLGIIALYSTVSIDMCVWFSSTLYHFETPTSVLTTSQTQSVDCPVPHYVRPTC